jgi:hypothetical protein
VPARTGAAPSRRPKPPTRGRGTSAVPCFTEVSFADRCVTRFDLEPEPPFPGLVRSEASRVAPGLKPRTVALLI